MLLVLYTLSQSSLTCCLSDLERHENTHAHTAGVAVIANISYSSPVQYFTFTFPKAPASQATDGLQITLAPQPGYKQTVQHMHAKCHTQPAAMALNTDMMSLRVIALHRMY